MGSQVVFMQAKETQLIVANCQGYGRVLCRTLQERLASR
jgi:hypothetical protein